MLTELAIAGGSLYCGVKAYHKRQRQKTLALFLQPAKGTWARLEDAQAAPTSSDRGRLLSLRQGLRREVLPWFTIPSYRTWTH